MRGEVQGTKPSLRAFLRANPFPHPLTEGFFYREKMRAIHAVSPDLAVERVLEVGGGQSGLTASLYPGALVTNVDANPEYAAAPPNRRPGTSFVCADATSLPFPNDTFDAVTMFDVLEHIQDDAAAVKEALRVLRPGGFLLVTSPNERWRFPYYRALRLICPTDEEMMALWGHVRRGYSLADLERLVRFPPLETATFIGPLTVVCHDVSFSRLPGPVRRVLATGLAPLTWLGYRLHSSNSPGTESASSWLKPPQ